MLKTLAPLIVALSISFANATETPFLTTFDDFSGGLDTWTAPSALPKNRFTNWLNMSATAKAGAISTRNGYITKATWPVANDILDFFIYDTAQGSYYVASDGSSLRYSADGTTWTIIASGLPANSRFRFSVVNGILWCVSKRSFAYAFDGTTIYTLNGSSTEVGNPPKGASVIAYWLSRVWVANTPSEPSVIWYSSLVNRTTGELYNPLTSNAFNALNKIYIDKNSSAITALIPFNGFLVVFTDKGIYRISFFTTNDGTDIPSVQKITGAIGCASGGSVAEVNNSLIFLATDGLIYQLGSNVQDISRLINSKTRAIVQPEATGGDGIKLFSTKADLQTGVTTGGFYEAGEYNRIELTGNSRVLKESFADFGLTPSVLGTNPPARWYSYAPGGNGLVANMLWGSLYNVVGSTSTDAGSKNWEILNSTYPTYGKIFWDGSLKSVGNYGYSLFIPYAFRTPPAESTINYAFGFGLKSSVSGGVVTAESMCLLEWGGGSWLERDCRALNVVGGVCIPKLTDSTAYTDFGNGNVGDITAKAYTGSFSFEIRPDGMLRATATHFNYEECNIDIEYDYKDTYAYQMGVSLASTTVFGTYVAGARVLPGDPQSVSVDNIYVPGTPRTGSWTSPAIYAANNSAWGELGASVSVSTLSYSTDIIQSTTFYYRTSASSVFTSGWEAITPNTVISSAAVDYIQLKIDGVTPVAVEPYPNIQNIFVTWQTSLSSATQPAGAFYDGNYYMSASTGSAIAEPIFKLSLIPSPHWELYALTTNDLISNKSNIYGAVSKYIVQLESGTVDGSSNIPYQFESGDMTEGAPFYPKYVQYAIISYEKSESTATFGISVDNGNTWSENDIYFNDGSASTSRGVQRFNINVNPGTSYRIRMRRKSGVPVVIYGISIAGYISDTFSEF